MATSNLGYGFPLQTWNGFSDGQCHQRHGRTKGSNDIQDKELLGLKTEVPPGLGPRLGFAWGSCATWPGMTRVLMLLYRRIVWMRSCNFEALPICKAKVAEVPEEPAPMVETGVGESQLCILLFSLCFSSWSSIPMGNDSTVCKSWSCKIKEDWKGRRSSKIHVPTLSGQLF